MKHAWLALLACVFAAPLEAQQCTANPATCSNAANTALINLTIGRALQLVVTPTATSLTTPTPAHYDAGFAATTGPTTTIRSNAPWTLAISAGTTTWSAVNTQSEAARLNKPASDLTWSTSSSGTFTALGTTPVTVASGTATPGATAASLFYRTRYSWSLDTPGSYSLQIVFTISSP